MNASCPVQRSAARAFRACLLLALTALPGCLWMANGPLALIDDSWCDNKKPRDGLPDRYVDWPILPCQPVVPDRQPQAQALLADRTFVELSDAQAMDFSNTPTPGPPGQRVYLLRGVFLHDPPSQGFQVFSDGQQVAVSHYCMGMGPEWRIHRRAVLVRLPRPPGKVWVFCHMAV